MRKTRSSRARVPASVVSDAPEILAVQEDAEATFLSEPAVLDAPEFTVDDLPTEICETLGHDNDVAGFDGEGERVLGRKPPVVRTGSGIDDCAEAPFAGTPVPAVQPRPSEDSGMAADYFASSWAAGGPDGANAAASSRGVIKSKKGVGAGARRREQRRRAKERAAQTPDEEVARTARIVFQASRVAGRRSGAGARQKLWRREQEQAKLSRLSDAFQVDHLKFGELLTRWLDEKKHAKHPDRSMILKLRDDLTKFDEIGGFPAEFEGDPTVTYEAPNGKLAVHAAFVHELVRNEAKEKWLEKTGEPPKGPYRTSPVFVLPKKTGGKANGKFRFIHHLSWSPQPGVVGSVNEGCPLTLKIEYENVDDYAEKILKMQQNGRRVLLWKADLDAAYKQWPYEESHRSRMGFRWLDIDKEIPADILSGAREPRDDELVYYWPNRLPFGWTKSVSHFHRVSRALKALHLWEDTPELTVKLPRWAHDTSVYVDDCGGLALAAWAEQSKKRYFELCGLLKIPISVKKDLLEGAIEATKEFLGILVDTLKGELRLSPERVEEGLRRLKELDGKAYVSTKELRSLVGVLSFAARCCRHARTFLRRCWDLLGRSKGRFCRLGRSVQCDLAWWKRFWKDYNGCSLTAELGWQLSEDIGLFTDASLKGWGAVHGSEWMGGQWPASVAGLDINELELLTLVLAAKRWGPKWARKRIITTIDNQAAMYTINKGDAKNPVLMVLMRELFLSAAKSDFSMKAQYLESKLNVMADAISRNDLTRFFEHARLVLKVDPSEWTEVKCDAGELEKIIQRMQRARRAERRRQAHAK